MQPHFGKIFDWFKGDFLDYLRVKQGIVEPHIAGYVALYLEGSIARALAKAPIGGLTLKYLDYDKGLNEQ